MYSPTIMSVYAPKESDLETFWWDIKNKLQLHFDSSIIRSELQEFVVSALPIRSVTFEHNNLTKILTFSYYKKSNFTLIKVDLDALKNGKQLMEAPSEDVCFFKNCVDEGLLHTVSWYESSGKKKWGLINRVELLMYFKTIEQYLIDKITNIEQDFEVLKKAPKVDNSKLSEARSILTSVYAENKINLQIMSEHEHFVKEMEEYLAFQLGSGYQQLQKMLV